MRYVSLVRIIGCAAFLVSLVACNTALEQGAVSSYDSEVSVADAPADSSRNDLLELAVDVRILGGARTRGFVDDALNTVARIYRGCQLALTFATQESPDESATDVDSAARFRLARELGTRVPTVFVVTSTAERDVAFSYLLSQRRKVSGSAWITERASERCFAWITAHEIGHILLDSATHHPQRRNVMHARCSGNSNYNRTTTPPRWTDQQCRQLRDGVQL